MGTLFQSAVAGLIAALAATAILGIANYSQQFWAKHQDVKYLRSLLTNGQKRVMSAEDVFHPGMGATMRADVLRAAQYNHMMKQVGIALESRTVHLSHDQRKDRYDALDWYNQSGLLAVENDGEVQFVEVPDGRWPTETMSYQQAKYRFDSLKAIKWLKLR